MSELKPEAEEAIEATEPKVVEKKPKKKKKHLKNWVKCVLSALMAFGVCVLVMAFAVQPARVSGQSMSPTLSDQEFGIINKIGKTLGGIDRGEIVVIKKDNGELLVKRVVGMPGDTIKAESGKIYINGTQLDESTYLDSSVATEDFAEITIGEDEYFCLGDNRGNSLDSRFYGAFDNDQILGIFIGF